MDINSDDHNEDSLELTPASNSEEGLHATADVSDTHLDSFQKEPALFLLKAKEERKLTQVRSIACVHDCLSKLIRHNRLSLIMLKVAVDNITQDVTKLWGANLSLLKQRITHELESSELAPDTLQRIIQCFDGTALTPFAGLETLYKQQMYYRENFNLLVS